MLATWMKMLYNDHCDETGKKAKSKGNVAWCPVDAQIFRKKIKSRDVHGHPLKNSWLKLLRSSEHILI